MRLIDLRTSSARTLVAVVLLCVGVPYLAYAQVPPPPGGGGGDFELPFFIPPLASGGTVVVGQINNTNSGVILNVPIPNDPFYDGGIIQPDVSMDEINYFDVGATHLIDSGELDTAIDLPEITVEEIKAALGIAAFLEDMTFTFRVTTTDNASTVHEPFALGQLEVVLGVEDTTAPEIEDHSDVTADATSAAGAVVTYTNPTASDDVDGPVSVSCLPASGSTFALGDTTVTCNATDSSSNNAVATEFTVHVVGIVPTPAPTGGSYTSAQSVTLAATGPTDIRYTIDGSTPTCASGSLYTGAISVAASQTIKAVSCYGSESPVASQVGSFEYTISTTEESTSSGGGGGNSRKPTVATTTDETASSSPPPLLTEESPPLREIHTPLEFGGTVGEVPSKEAETELASAQVAAAAATGDTLWKWWWLIALLVAALLGSYWAWKKYKEYKEGKTEAPLV